MASLRAWVLIGLLVLGGSANSAVAAPSESAASCESGSDTSSSTTCTLPDLNDAPVGARPDLHFEDGFLSPELREELIQVIEGLPAVHF